MLTISEIMLSMLLLRWIKTAMTILNDCAGIYEETTYMCPLSIICLFSKFFSLLWLICPKHILNNPVSLCPWTDNLTAFYQSWMNFIILFYPFLSRSTHMGIHCQPLIQTILLPAQLFVLSVIITALLNSYRAVIVLIETLHPLFCLFAGCWFFPVEDHDCSPRTCLSNTPPHKFPKHHDSKFCCCSGSMCNANISDVYDPELYTTEHPVTPGWCGQVWFLSYSYFMYIYWASFQHSHWNS